MIFMANFNPATRSLEVESITDTEPQIPKRFTQGEFYNNIAGIRAYEIAMINENSKVKIWL